MRAAWLAVAAAPLAVLALGGPASAAPAAQTGTVVSPKVPLNVRTGPATWNPRVRTLPNGSPVALVCQTKGQLVSLGTVRVTDLWT